MKLIAKVGSNLGKTSHFLAELVNGVPTPVEKLPDAVRVEILEEPEGFFLVRYDAVGNFAGDSFHESVEAAKRQAKFEYEIQEEDWRSE